MADMDELSYETDDVVAAESETDSIFDSVSSIVSFVEGRFKRAEDVKKQKRKEQYGIQKNIVKK